MPKRQDRAALAAHGGVGLGVLCAAVAIGAGGAFSPAAAHDDEGPRIQPLPVKTRGMPALAATITPVQGGLPGADGQGGVAGGCLPVTQVYTGLDFSCPGGCAVIAQGGMVEGEIAAVQFMVPPDQFPIVIRTAELIWAQTHFNQTTTQWSLMIWDGNPETGALVDTFSSDDVILPHLRLPIGGSSAANLNVTVDPSDPEQVTITNSTGQNSFTIGYRIDQHNNQSGGACGPASETSNAFPTTENTGGSGSSQPTLNWLYGQPVCTFCTNWNRFSELPEFICRPTGDWNMRVTYEPLNCVPGACCIPDGSCALMTDASCDDVNGFFLGSGQLCDGSCPDPTGACCFGGPKSSCNQQTEIGCAAGGGTWLGAGVACSPSQCSTATTGACCFSNDTCSNGFTESDCTIFDGTFQGNGTSCAQIECNPIGACCLPEGGCLESVSPDDCSAAGGNFQGNGLTCSASNCPQPTGACCAASGGCAVFLQATCEGIPNAMWAGPFTTCADLDGSGVADDCEANPADVNVDGVVNVDDLVQVIVNWGNAGGPADVNGDEVVNVDDLVQVIVNWSSPG